MRTLPRHYWAIMLAWLTWWGLTSALIAASLGTDPYVGFAVGWGLPLLLEVWHLRRAGLRRVRR